jgi:hypothetical protein
MKKVKAFLEFSRSKAGLPAFLVLILLASTACMRERIEGNYDLILKPAGAAPLPVLFPKATSGCILFRVMYPLLK